MKAQGRSRRQAAMVRHVMLAVGVGSAALLLSAPIVAQGRRPSGAAAAPPPHADSKPWTGPRLPDGQPDVQGGLWGAILVTSSDLENPIQVNIDYNDDGGGRTVPSRITDPPDGKIPYQPWAAAKKQELRTARDNPQRPEDVDTQQRCLVSPPRTYYGFFNFRIVQQPGYVIFLFTQFHPYLVIPITEDRYVHPGPNLKLWMGFTRGRWEGNTLVVETFNQNGKNRLTQSGDFFTDQARFTERFTFLDADTMTYEATIEDPNVYTRPWTIRVAEKRRPDDEFWEDACPEGMEVERSIFKKMYSLEK